jgi:HEAT repeat protein
MPTPQADRAADRADRAGRGRAVLLAFCLLAAPALALAQVPFEQAVSDLGSPDAGVRLRAATLLKASAYPEAAIPLAKAVGDSQDQVQLEAIAAELNIFLAKKIVPRKRVGLIIEVRTRIAAETAFSAGPLALGATPAPMEVLTALWTAARDKNPRVGLEALYAFGTLAAGPAGPARRALQELAAPDLAAMVGASDQALRAAAVRVIGRLFEVRPSDDAADMRVGDAIITALNDNNQLMKRMAMDALGAMRYGRAVDALTKLFQFYGHGESAEGALDALARIADPASIPLFAAQLAARAPALKAIGIEGLARAGDSSRATAIEAALNSERSDAVLLAGTFASAMLAGGPIDRITEALLRPRLHDVSKQYLMEIARGRPDRMSRYVQDPDPRIRADIVDVLGFTDNPAALPIVEPLVKDQDPQVALAAERAGARLRGSDRRGAR